jgi:hypothetical protein
VTPLTIPPEILRPASVLLVHRRGALGAAIRWVTRSPWNHSALIVGARFGEAPWTIEAHDLEGVRHCTLRDYTEDPAVLGLAVYDRPVLRPDLTIAQRNTIVEWAEARNGAAYDTRQLLGIYLRHRIPGCSLAENRLDDAGRMICSELVGRAYAAAGLNLCPRGVGLGCLAPGHLAETLVRVWEGWR